MNNLSGFPSQIARENSVGAMSGRPQGPYTVKKRKPVVGRPILYGTSKEFLMHFGLKDLSELPTLEEFAQMAGDQL